MVVRGAALSIGVDPGGSECDGLVDELLQAGLFDVGPPPGRSLSFLVFGVGWALFGLASLVGRVYPSSAAVLLIIGAVIGTVVSLTFLPVPLGWLPFEAAAAWLGVALLTGWGGSASGQPSRVSRTSENSPSTHSGE